MAKPAKTAKKTDGESKRMKNKEYTKEVRRLQVKLCQLQDWIKQTCTGDHCV